MAGLDVSGDVARTLLQRGENTLKTIEGLQVAILRWLKEQRSLEAMRTDGVGEASFATLCKAIDKKHGEQLAYCEVPKDVYEDMAKTGILQNGALRTYSAMSSTHSDNIIIFYGSKDQEGMNSILDAMDSMYGKRSEVSKDSFEILSEDRDLYVLDGVRPEDAMLLSHLTENHEEYSVEPFPFTVVQQPGKDKYSVVCLDEDKGKLAAAVGLVAATYTSEQGSRVLQQVQYKIKGKQERNIDIDNARKHQVIMDREFPQNHFVVTASDYKFYKNNKEVESISRKGPLNRVYDIIEGMSAPVVIDERRYEQLSTSETMEALHNEGKPITLTSDRDIEIDIKQSLAQMEREQEVKEYMKGMSGTTVQGDTRDLNKIVGRAEREAARQEKEQEPSGGYVYREDPFIR